MVVRCNEAPNDTYFPLTADDRDNPLTWLLCGPYSLYENRHCHFEGEHELSCEICCTVSFYRVNILALVATRFRFMQVPVTWYRFCHHPSLLCNELGIRATIPRLTDFVYMAKGCELSSLCPSASTPDYSLGRRPWGQQNAEMKVRSFQIHEFCALSVSVGLIFVRRSVTLTTGMVESLCVSLCCLFALFRSPQPIS